MSKRREKQKEQEELLSTLGDFTSKDNWDKFFSIRGSGDSFEWYGEWAQLRDPLLSHLPKPLSSEEELLQILVPGCGNSRLSEELYDAGFKCITNIDFSKVVIGDMLRRNVRLRPGMRWRLMDMTSMQFEDEIFDIVVDKGGLDALMEPEHGSKLGNLYLSEVKRVLRFGGKFICLSLAESHVLGLLLPKFRYGWKVSLHVIPQKPAKKPNLHTFMLIFEKETSPLLHQISSTINLSSFGHSGNQACGLLNALERENGIRVEYSTGSDLIYSLEDLKLGAKGDLSDFSPGRRVQITLGEEGISLFSYRAVLLDANTQADAFVYYCGVFLVPKARAHEWLFSSEEGQWMIVESSKAARLIMVLLDSSHSHASMNDIQKDLSPLIKQLAPESNDSGAQIPFMAASNGIKHQKIVHQVTSPLTGLIVIDDVVYEKADDSSSLSSSDLVFRRLTFQRRESLVQSEALLIDEGCPIVPGELERRKTRSVSKSRKRVSQQKREPRVSVSDDSKGHLRVDHNYLASSYHSGIVAGIMLISSFLESASSERTMVKAVIIGLGAGLLPMFLHAILPVLHIKTVELDPIVLDVARGFFGFSEDKRLKVHISDGIDFVKQVAKEKASKGEGAGANGIGILVVDVDSSDSSSGLTCPASDFVEESFLSDVKSSLSEQGLFIINLVTRSSSVRHMVVSRMKKVFTNLFHLRLEEDVNEVIFALNANDHVNGECFSEASSHLEKLLKLEHPEGKQRIVDAAKKIESLK